MNQGYEEGDLLPTHNIMKFMKEALPAKAKVSENAKQAVRKCVYEFIIFVTGEASENCKLRGKKTLIGEDVIEALRGLGFDQYVEPLQAYLEAYRSSISQIPNISGLATEEEEADDDEEQD